MAGDKFVNPYNFIQFPEKKALAYKDTDRHTGVISYTVTTKTPLFIPNSSSESAFQESDETREHKSYDFFSYTELKPKKRYEEEPHIPIIPGSEMRGVVRNVYETLTDSCMGILNEEVHPIKRTMEGFEPALIYRREKGDLVLLKAKSLSIGDKADRGSVPKGFEDYKNGTEIYYKEPLADTKPILQYSTRKEKSLRKTGYLLKWGMGVRKKRYHVFSLTSDKRMIPLVKEDIERLIAVINSYLEQPSLTKRKDDERAYKEYKENLEGFLKGKSGKYFPVNYSKLDKIVLYLAPAIFTKEVSENKIGMLAGEFAPCKENFCPTCALFGYVRENGGVSGSSRIRFTDLYVTENKKAEEYYLCDEKKNGKVEKKNGKRTLQTLSGPKLGNVDFYLKRPEGATFWTYDYYVQDKNGKGKTVKTEKGELRGRKYYWHHRNVNFPDVQKTNLNKTIRPVAAKNTFEGKLYFENISEKQLKQLIWILDSESEGLGLKLGAGKPLGLGSISCKVNDVKKRTITMENERLEYKMEPFLWGKISYGEKGAEFSLSVKEEFYKIARLESISSDIEITYPKDERQKINPVLTEGYRWFVNNHQKGMKTKRTDMEIKKILPYILDKNLGLPYDLNG